MSGKSLPKPKKPARTRKIDPRVRHTRDILGDALVALIHEKPFDSIRVQDVLDRAGVGRSTFYTHFTDKDDLFLSDVEDFFGMMASLLTTRRELSDRVAAVRELFAHVGESQKFLAALAAAGKVQDIFELGTGIFARGIEERLAGMPRSRNLERGQRAAMSHALAGAMFSLLSWWLSQSNRESPERMDDTFHRMVWAGLTSPLPAHPQKTSLR
jgi:AcrR family transcriptional regulator